jgi:hypothetical protein
MSRSPTLKECFFFWGNFGTLQQKKSSAKDFLGKYICQSCHIFEKKYLILKSPYFEEYIAKTKQDSRTFLLSSTTSFSQIWRLRLKDDHQST